MFYFVLLRQNASQPAPTPKIFFETFSPGFLFRFQNTDDPGDDHAGYVRGFIWRRDRAPADLCEGYFTGDTPGAWFFECGFTRRFSRLCPRDDLSPAHAKGR